MNEQLSFYFMEDEGFDLPSDAIRASNDNPITDRKQRQDEPEHLYMALHTQPRSSDAITMISALASAIYDALDIPRRPTKAFVFGLGAIVSDLLEGLAYHPAKHCHRHLRAGSFTDAAIGYKAFVRLLGFMQLSGFVEVEKGKWFRRSADGEGKLSVIKAMPKLLRFALAYGVTHNTHSVHFMRLPRPASIAAPIKLSRERVRNLGVKLPKSVMVIDPADMEAKALWEQVNRLNAYFAKQDISPDRHYAFQRQFHNGDTLGFDWNKGGRLYSLGNGYQQMSQDERAKMLINGEPGVELDIGSSHIRILYGLFGQPLDPAVDPYEMNGFPRPVVKDFVTMTLGHNGFQRAWSPRKKEEYAERGIDLQKSYPIAKVREAVLNHLPLLQEWESSLIRWDDLQFVESCAVIECMEILAFEHDVPALPVHDSIIVPANDQALAMDVLSSCFQKHTGAVPMLKVK